MKKRSGVVFWLVLSGVFLSARLRAAEFSQRYYYEDIFTPFFAKDGKDPGLWRAVRPMATPSSFRMPKAGDTFRVFLVGGSIARVFATDKRTLEDALEQVLPGRHVEVIPCGMDGYDSYREALVLQEILEYQPDLVVLMPGHNERLASPPIPIWIFKARERLERWKAFRELVSTLHPDSQPPASSEELTRLVQERDAQFARNLAMNIHSVRERGVPIAVVVPPLNYRDAPSDLPLPGQNPDFMKGWVRYVRGDCEGAAPYFQTAVSAMRDSESAEDNKSLAYFFLGSCAEKEGRREAAFADYQAAIVDDWGASRCSARCADEIRTASREQGAMAVEVDKAFRDADGPNIPGSDMFEDRIHWRPPYNAVVALEIVKALMASKALSSEPWDQKAYVALQEQWRRPMMGWDELSYVKTLFFAFSEMKKVGPQASLQAVSYLNAIHQRYPEWFQRPQGLAQELDKYGHLDKSVSQDRIDLHVGEMYLYQGDYRRAAEFFSDALGTRPGLFRVRLDLAVAQDFLGDTKDSLRNIEKARADGEDARQMRLPEIEADILMKALALR